MHIFYRETVEEVASAAQIFSERLDWFSKNNEQSWEPGHPTLT